MAVANGRALTGELALLGHDLRTSLTIINGYAQMLKSDERYIREAASRMLAQLNAAEAIDQLTTRVQEAHERLGRFPTGWRERVSLGLLPGLPLDPAGAPFVYDDTTHLVTLSPESSLAPLPAAFLQK